MISPGILSIVAPEELGAAAAEAGPPLLVSLGLPMLAVILSPLTAWLTFHFVKKRELAESLRLEIQRLELVKKPELAANLSAELAREVELAALNEEHSRRERVRQETLRWANPILAGVEDLRARMSNILDHAGYLALAPTWQRSGNWSITHDYFLSSTLYLFSAYFGYVELLRRSLSFELFQSETEKDLLFQAIDRVAYNLGSFPPPWSCEGTDSQVFRLQQRALGELMIVDRGQAPTCMTYPDFLDNLHDDRFVPHIAPLRELIEAVGPGIQDCRWRRLEETRNALTALSTICRRLLSTPGKDS